MTDPGTLERLVDHLEWANGRALEAVRTSASGEALELVAHVVAAERVWLRRIATGSSAELEIWPELTAAACEEAMRENVRDLRRLAASASEDDLRRPVEYANSEGTEYRTPLGEILLHVALHGAHHRGQIARSVRRAGAAPTNTDFITFVREDPG